MYEVLISDGTTTLHFSLYILWGTGLHGVVVSLARRKTDEFDSRVLHQGSYGSSHLDYWFSYWKTKSFSFNFYFPLDDYNTKRKMKWCVTPRFHNALRVTEREVRVMVCSTNWLSRHPLKVEVMGSTPMQITIMLGSTSGLSHRPFVGLV